jgi:DNA-binding CsgD family transcriptional regulator
MGASTRYQAWVDLVADLAATPSHQFPRDCLMQMLSATYGSIVTWEELRSDGTRGFEMSEPLGDFPTDEETEIIVSYGLQLHPLVRWFARTGDPAPMSLERIPREMVPREGFLVVREVLGPRGIDQQLAIPYHLGADRQAAFIMNRGDHDYDDEEFDLAGRIQPLLMVLSRQADALTSATPDALSDGRLTPRELAVLDLLSDGLTAEAIGHRLLISPRTVHAHLGRIYRKLEVSDRVLAVTTAQQLGLLPVATPPRPAQPPR